MDGRVLHFYLAGINDENFLMRDRETGSWWQQVSGRAIAGPLRGARLRLLSSEEISFGLWRREYPWGTVLAPVAADRKNYVRAGWVKRYHKYAVVVPLPHGPLKGRSLVVGVTLAGHSVAYPLAQVAKQGVIEDTLGDTPILVALGPDQRTVRVFARRAPGLPAEDSFFKEVAAPAADAGTKGRAASEAKRVRKPLAAVAARPAVRPAHPAPNTAASPRTGGKAASTAPGKGRKTAKASKPFTLGPWKLLDAATGSQWDFRGCAIQGKEQGRCLPILPSLTEDWFDWHHYHPQSRVWSVGLPR